MRPLAHHGISTCALAIGLSVALCDTGSAQSKADADARKAANSRRFGDPSKSARQTDRQRTASPITVELITGDDAVGSRAYRWNQIFDKLNVTLTIRRARSGEKIAISEKKEGQSREVVVVGKLHPSGKLEFTDRVFSEDDVDKLTDWLSELREYGAQGSPAGMPAWGLNKEQFTEIYESLAKRLTVDLLEAELPEALQAFQLPAGVGLKFSDSAQRLLQSHKAPAQVGQSLKGVSQGTALALILSEQGLGFRPTRTPKGAIELTVLPLTEKQRFWPIGWPRQGTAPETAPKLFEFTPVDLEEIELDAVLGAASDILAMPILVDRAGLAEQQIDLSSVKVSHPRKRTTWGLALNDLLRQAKLKYELLIDESGRPFLWITPFATPRRPQKD